MNVTLAQILDAITTTLETATTNPRGESYDELTESIPDLPLLQVYPESANQDPAGGTERTSFGAGVRQTSLVVNADYYARQRSDIGEDMAALVNGIDAITDVLEGQDKKPYFGLDGIKAFAWSWSRVVFLYGDPEQKYIGARFVITLRFF